ncbi:type II secretion system major pseudopilin GspG [Iocasia frigidifontis]|uniref:Type II secretion system core protein G n=1 Tax=Iocasia fonsfrigidae TaxID=2682810 RepID=A0A8A7KE41_9FIRM|nr:type II secretion system major pseudopilin GspG [Iocasia fonsfrigidae]QTL97157.1 type II secretion system major pseudopilin GspG [Iocasia fonsfrigidae]
MLRTLKKEDGFTLIEILIVVVIIGFLAATVGPNLFNRVSEARQTAAQNQMDIFKLALDNYRLDNGQYPTTQQGLAALIKEPGIPPLAKNWNGPYLDKKEIPLDPWGNEYQYLIPGNHNDHKYDLWSRGKDGSDGDEDGSGEGADVTNW